MKISKLLLDWYKKNKRDLPWRSVSDPYKVWLSEVILQQTRVEQGLAYYLKFTKRFPDLKMLAAADEQEVLKLWQGLGYYSRARNLLAAARQVMESYGGIFPSDYASLLKLKGVGRYTAAAVASFSSGEAVAVVDGNVLRLISRLYAISEPVNSKEGEGVVRKLATEILDRENAGEHNQAVMEFGALQCVPSNPDCGICPLNRLCEAYRMNRVKDFPVKIRKGTVKRRYFTYLLIGQSGDTYIYRRTGNDIWKELYEFPMVESEGLVTKEALFQLIAEHTGMEVGDFSLMSVSDLVKHQLTHRTIFAQFVHLTVLNPSFQGLPGWIRISSATVGDYPLPRLIDRYLEEAGDFYYN